MKNIILSSLLLSSLSVFAMENNRQKEARMERFGQSLQQASQTDRIEHGIQNTAANVYTLCKYTQEVIGDQIPAIFEWLKHLSFRQDELAQNQEALSRNHAIIIQQQQQIIALLQQQAAKRAPAKTKSTTRGDW